MMALQRCLLHCIPCISNIYCNEVTHIGTLRQLGHAFLVVQWVGCVSARKG